MRIISGKFRRRALLSPPLVTRPTSDRTRESIFNILYSLDRDLLEGALVLDAFAGSGALGLEALSRGAAHVTFWEKNTDVIRTLKENIAALGVMSHCSVRMGDAMTPPKALYPATLVFLDPPYDQALEMPCLAALSTQGWIQPQTLIVLETSAKRALNLPQNATLIHQRRSGAALVSFLRLTLDGRDAP